MTDSTSTPYSNRCDILAELWVTYKGDPEFQDFFEYNDLGLPIAYAIATQIVEATPKSEIFVNETFDLLMSGLEIEDTGFDSLADLLMEAEGKPE